MIKVALTALAMASVVFAQSTTGSASTTSSASTAQSTNVPASATTRCKTFLSALDQDRTVNNCLNSLITATDSFDVTASTNTTATTVNGTAITQALTKICSSDFSSACPPTSIRTSLTNFYTECSSDLLGPTGDGTQGNAGVIQIYDVLYLILPLRTAICTQVDGKYCLNNSTTPATTPSSPLSSSSSAPAPSASNAKRDAGLVAADLVKRAENTNVLVGRQASNTTQTQLGNGPNADEYRSSGLPYLFLKPDSSDICSKCTYNIIKGYITFETVTPYAIGIANSPMLKGQLALWQKIKTCPDNFATSLLNDATGVAAATSGASRIVFGSAVVGVMSVVGVAVAALL